MALHSQSPVSFASCQNSNAHCTHISYILKAVLWIRFGFNADSGNADPDLGFDDFICKIYLFLGLHEGRPSKENILNFKAIHFFTFFFLWFICAPGIWMRIQTSMDLLLDTVKWTVSRD